MKYCWSLYFIRAQNIIWIIMCIFTLSKYYFLFCYQWHCKEKFAFHQQRSPIWACFLVLHFSCFRVPLLGWTTVSKVLDICHIKIPWLYFQNHKIKIFRWFATILFCRSTLLMMTIFTCMCRSRLLILPYTKRYIIYKQQTIKSMTIQLCHMEFFSMGLGW